MICGYVNCLYKKNRISKNVKLNDEMTLQFFGANSNSMYSISKRKIRFDFLLSLKPVSIAVIDFFYMPLYYTPYFDPLKKHTIAQLAHFKYPSKKLSRVFFQEIINGYFPTSSCFGNHMLSIWVKCNLARYFY